MPSGRSKTKVAAAGFHCAAWPIKGSTPTWLPPPCPRPLLLLGISVLLPCLQMRQPMAPASGTKESKHATGASRGRSVLLQCLQMRQMPIHKLFVTSSHPFSEIINELMLSLNLPSRMSSPPVFPMPCLLRPRITSSPAHSLCHDTPYHFSFSLMCHEHFRPRGPQLSSSLHQAFPFYRFCPASFLPMCSSSKSVFLKPF